MQIVWNRIWKRRDYQYGTFAERRMIEFRYSLGKALRKLRRRNGVTQCNLAHLIGASQATISRIERASTRVSLELVVLAFLALGASDWEIAGAFNAGAQRDIQWVRQRAAKRLARRPSPGLRLPKGFGRDVVRDGTTSPNSQKAAWLRPGVPHRA